MKIAIASGKGGTGKTLVSTNLFNILLKKGYKTSLVDCDAEAPNAIAFFDAKLLSVSNVYHSVPVINTNNCIFCGKCHEYCNYNAIFILPPVKVIKVMEDLCHGCGACSVACSYGAITEKHVSLGEVSSYSFNGNLNSSLIEARMNIGVMSPVSVIKQAIKSADSESKVVILDSPPGTSCPFVQTVNKADYIILVTEPTPFGLSDLQQSVETLKEMGKLYGVIINKAGLGSRVVHDYLAKEKITLLSEIPFDKRIAELYSKGALVSTLLPEVEEQLSNALQQILEKNGNSNN